MKGDGEEGTPVDTPRGEREWNGQDDKNGAAEDVTTAASEVRERMERGSGLYCYERSVCGILMRSAPC